MRKQRQKRKFKVSVTRTAYAGADVEVEARGAAEARKLALARAGDLEFSEHDAEYEAEVLEDQDGQSAQPAVPRCQGEAPPGRCP
jgi:hypothetical protein